MFSSDLSIWLIGNKSKSWISGVVPTFCLHDDMPFLSGISAAKVINELMCLLGIKKGHALSDTARCLKILRKENPPQVSTCEGLFFSAYQFYHLHIFIVIPLTCQCSASSLPIYFHFSSSLFYMYFFHLRLHFFWSCKCPKHSSI